MIGFELLPLALLGAIVGLDVVSFPQAMISRPIVAATIAGAFVGDPLAGLLAGATMELIALETLPIGASRYPEWGSASVVTGALVASQPGFPVGVLTLTVLAGVTTAWIGGWSMHQLRRLNAHWAREAEPRVERGDRSAVNGLQIRGLTADLVRGGALTLGALLVARPVIEWALSRWTLDAGLSRAAVAGVAAASALAAVWTLTHGTAGSRWLLLAGLAAGATIVWGLRV